MKAVVDTNVTAYYLLETEPFASEAERFWRALTQAIAPTFWEAELAHVVWMMIRADLISAEKGRYRLRHAAALGIQTVPVSEIWHGALDRSLASGVAVYDTLFVELADREGNPISHIRQGCAEGVPPNRQAAGRDCRKVVTRTKSRLCENGAHASSRPGLCACGRAGYPPGAAN